MSDADAAGIDAIGVGAWLQANTASEPPFSFHRLAGGHSNLTHRVDDASGRSLVLRRPPLGHLLPTAHDMGREFLIITGLHRTDVPVPAPIAFCEDTRVTGAPFYLMEFVSGPVLHTRKHAAEAYDIDQRRQAGESFIDVLAALHEVEPESVGLGQLGRTKGYIERQLKRWHAQWEQSKTRDLPAVDRAHGNLCARIPDQGPARVVHGDYRLGNCITHPTTGEVLAVLDWEIATLGDPLADLGYVLATWSEPTDPDPDPDVPSMVEGFPSRAELLERYASQSGRDVSNIAFYTGFSFWKSACIVEGVYARYLEGALDTTGVDVAGFRVAVERLARMAEETVAALD